MDAQPALAHGGDDPLTGLVRVEAGLDRVGLFGQFAVLASFDSGAVAHDAGADHARAQDRGPDAVRDQFRLRPQ